jgi:hypothetical protein
VEGKNVLSSAVCTVDPREIPGDVPDREADTTTDVEAAIEGARRLLGDALESARHRQRATTVRVGPKPVVRMLSHYARREAGLPVRVHCDSLSEFSAVLGADVGLLLREQLAAGHRVSVLHHDLSALRGPDTESLTALAEAGAEVRLLPRKLPGMAATEGEVALIQAGGTAAPRVLLVASPEVIQAAHRLHDGLRDLAVDFIVLRRTVSGLLRPGPHVDVLNLLCAGMKDETAARQLSVSVRTYRRYVAQILRALGVNSRFEAGMRVSELGLADVGRRLLAFAG